MFLPYYTSHACSKMFSLSYIRQTTLLAIYTPPNHLEDLDFVLIFQFSSIYIRQLVCLRGWTNLNSRVKTNLLQTRPERKLKSKVISILDHFKIEDEMETGLET